LSFDIALAKKTGIHGKTQYRIFGPKGNPAANLFYVIIVCL
jgi:DNA-binding phage protein